MKKKILNLMLFGMMVLTLTGCGKKESNKETDTTKELYRMIQNYYIPKVYQGYDTYSEYNFYMDKEVKYEDFSDEARLYYAYATIDNVDRKWFNTCDELKGYTYRNEDMVTTCNKGKGVIIEKNGSDEWFFYNVDKKMIDSAYHKMYGKDKEMPLKDFTMSVTGTCVYSGTNDNYLCFAQTGSDTSFQYPETKFDHYVEDKDTMEIYDRYLWIEMQEEGEAYYKSRLNKKNEKIDMSTKDFDKGALYKHTFKKDKDGNYYWYSSDRVE